MTGVHADASPRRGPVGVGVIGAGNISDQYLANLTRFPDLDVRFVADLDAERARAQAERHGVPGAGAVDDLLGDDGVELVVNLTIPAAHVEVGLRVLESGRHVFAEKPLALDLADGRRLLDRADALGLRVGSAPDTFLGPGPQAARRLVDDGAIGTPVTALALFQVGGPEAWHPNPEFLYAPGAGPLFDMGPYYLTALVNLLGPIGRVTAASSTSHPTRVIGSGPRAGESFPVLVPTYHAALLEFRGGAVGQAVFSFQSRRHHPPSIEVAGTEGSMAVPNPNGFDGATLVWTDDPETPREVRVPPTGSLRGIGALEFARALRAGEPARASGRLAEHVLEAMEAITVSAAAGRPVDLVTTADRPPLLADGWDPFAATSAEPVRARPAG